MIRHSFVNLKVHRLKAATTPLITTIVMMLLAGFTAVRAQVTEGGFATGTNRKVSNAVAAEMVLHGRASVLVVLQDQADVSAAYAITDRDERGWYVYNTLVEHAERTQASLGKELRGRGIPFTSFWIVSMIEVEADATLVEELAARADVARIESNSPTRWIEEPKIADLVSESIFSPEAIEWGVTNVRAPEMWAQGFTGQGIVIGDLDTGVRWTHGAIKSKYRGWNGTTADHNYNWWDAVHSGGGSCGANSTAPCDDNGHGSHTVGTILGDDGGPNQIGVAPGAKWIGCRNMNVGIGTPATYTECFQFMLAPTNLAGEKPDPSRRPHILNNSWSCPPSEGCTTRAELETTVSNVRAAGIFVSVSAGNAGPGCSTVNAPPGIYAGAFSVGATDQNNLLASFSSRGPSTFYTPNLLKPNISAPGVNVRSISSTSDTAYRNLSGTSMAAPHVSGVVALLWSARPHLVGKVAETRALLESTANPNVTLNSPQTCGGITSTAIPNNSFGYGRIDALAAFNAAVPPTTVNISGRVLTPQRQSLPGATVFLLDDNNNLRRTLTNQFGIFSFGDAALGREYIISVRSRSYKFSNTPVKPSDDVTGLEFVGRQ